MQQATGSCHSNQLAIFQALALSDGHHFTLLGFFLGGIGNVQAPSESVSLFLDALDHNAVV